MKQVIRFSFYTFLLTHCVILETNFLSLTKNKTTKEKTRNGGMQVKYDECSRGWLNGLSVPEDMPIPK